MERRSPRNIKPPDYYTPSQRASSSRQVLRPAAKSSTSSKSPTLSKSPKESMEVEPYDLRTPDAQAYHLEHVLLPNLTAELEILIQKYRSNYGASSDELDDLEFPPSKLPEEVTRELTQKEKDAWLIRRKYENIRSTNIAISLYKDKLAKESHTHVDKYNKTITYLKANQDKRLTVLTELFGTSPVISSAIALHHKILIESPILDIDDWCKRLNEAQQQVIRQINSSRQGNGNMYMTFTTPLICYLRYLQLSSSPDYQKYIDLFPEEIVNLLSNPANASCIMMSDSHRFIDMSISIFRQLFTDGLGLSKLYGKNGTSGTLKTGCKQNTLHFFSQESPQTQESINKKQKTSSHESKQVPQEIKINCLRCGETLFDMVGNTLVAGTHKTHACDHTIPVASAYYYLRPQWFQMNLLYLCRTCNLEKSDMEIIDFLYDMFTNPSMVYGKSVYKKVFKELAKGFRPLEDIVNGLTELKSVYDSSVEIKTGTLDEHIKEIDVAIALVQSSQRDSAQAFKQDAPKLLKMFTDIIHRMLISNVVSGEGFTLDQLARNLETQILSIGVGNKNITHIYIVSYLIKLSNKTQDYDWKGARELSMHSDGIATVLMEQADTDRDGVISSEEFKDFFIDVARQIQKTQQQYRPTIEGQGRGGSFNKGTIRRKIKSKITKKLNHRKIKSKITKKLNHRKIKSQKSYRKHTNRLRKHKSFFTKTLKKKI